MRVCFIQSQGHMYSGGQGVYLHYVTRELARMGHDIHVIAGVPYPTVAPEVQLHKLKTFSFWSYLDNFDEYAYRTHPLLYFHPVNLFELISTRIALSSLLLTFSVRAYVKLNELARHHRFDIIHDNQTLSYGTILMQASGYPVVATIHHPLSVDLRNSLAQSASLYERARRLLWYPWIMQEVAARLKTCIREADTAARLGGDEFVVMLNELSENPDEARRQAEAVGEKVLAALNRLYVLFGKEHHNTPSIGITLYADRQTTVDDVLKQADLAMYQAKSAGRNTLRFFDPGLPADPKVDA